MHRNILDWLPPGASPGYWRSTARIVTNSCDGDREPEGWCRRAFGQGGGNHAGRDGVVGVHLGGALPGGAPVRRAGRGGLEGDWRGEEEGVQRRAVGSFADVRVGGDGVQRRTLGLGGEQRGEERHLRCGRGAHVHSSRLCWSRTPVYPGPGGASSVWAPARPACTPTGSVRHLRGAGPRVWRAHGLAQAVVYGDERLGPPLAGRSPRLRDDEGRRVHRRSRKQPSVSGRGPPAATATARSMRSSGGPACTPFHRTHSGSSAFAPTVTGWSGIQSSIKVSRYRARCGEAACWVPGRAPSSHSAASASTASGSGSVPCAARYQAVNASAVGFVSTSVNRFLASGSVIPRLRSVRARSWVRRRARNQLSMTARGSVPLTMSSPVWQWARQDNWSPVTTGAGSA